MAGKQSKTKRLDRASWQIVGVVLMLLLAGMMLMKNEFNSIQSMDASPAPLRFEGEYRIGEGQWKEIKKGEHIPATKGDVTLRGDFKMFTPDGEFWDVSDREVVAAFYLNHIGITVKKKDGQPMRLECEHPMLGIYACGEVWCSYRFGPDEAKDVEITIHNPHRFGNDTAVDELLSNLALWTGATFERNMMFEGRSQRNRGMMFVIAAFFVMGVGIFASILKIKEGKLLLLMGMSILSAGIYVIYDSDGFYFWNRTVHMNTSMTLFTAIFYLLFICGIIVHLLDKQKKTGTAAIIALWAADMIMIVLSMVTDVHFYDMVLFWAVVQTVVNLVVIGCAAAEYNHLPARSRSIHIVSALILVAFEMDVVMIANGRWSGGVASQYVFLVAFVAAFISAILYFPTSVKTTIRARELEVENNRIEAEKKAIEAELKENRIAIMLSQIQPHFIYNTLGTIERMCLKDPQKAFELVRNFSLYLRGNFSELDSMTPIQFTEEIKHVQYYVNIEKVRFPDMDISYKFEAEDFVLPALTVQPLVENAIKHGLMRLEEGGSVVIRSYETDTHFCVEVKDDGVGFDTDLPVNSKKHVGLRNIRGRLAAMVNGELIVESTEGVGTVATILIPKEGEE